MPQHSRPAMGAGPDSRRSAVDGRTSAGSGYAQSQRVRKQIEQSFAWTKTVGGLRKLKRRGLTWVSGFVAWNMAAYNLSRLGGIGGWWAPAPT